MLAFVRWLIDIVPEEDNEGEWFDEDGWRDVGERGIIVLQLVLERVVRVFVDMSCSSFEDDTFWELLEFVFMPRRMAVRNSIAAWNREWDKQHGKDARNTSVIYLDEYR